MGGAARGTNYYVSPSGSDSNPGTSPEQAWQSIDKVNTVTFSAGDSIFFEGGQTFSGALYFDEGGTSTNPITVGSYGPGRATISSGSSDGCYVYEAGGYEIRDLIFVGSGPLDPDGGSGVKFQTDNSTRYYYVRLDNLDISQYHWKGIAFAAPTGVGYTDVAVTNTDSHDNGDYGMTTWGAWPPGASKAHEDFYVGYCNFYDNRGIPGRAPHSGNGLEMDDIDGSLVEFCKAWNNGELCNASGGGPFGIWQWQVDDAVIQFCESYLNKTSGGDGGGFDLDGGCRYNIIQYCYSHDNYGAGYGVFQIKKAQTHIDNVIRYNISENDSLYNKHGAVYFWADNGTNISNVDVYNNTLYKPAKGATILAWTSNFSNLNLYNNIIFSTYDKAVMQLENASAFDFLGNCYWSDGNDLEINWGSSTYTSLAEWRTATGQETLNGNPVGMETDPLLSGGVGDVAFMLQSNSPLIDQGLDLQTEFGLDPGTQDYYGTTIPVDGYFDIGAHECVTEVTEATNPKPADEATNVGINSDLSWTPGVAASSHDVYFGTDYNSVADANHSSGEYKGNQALDANSYEPGTMETDTTYYWAIDEVNDPCIWPGDVWSFTTEAAPDTTPPSPDPMTWSTVPYATGTSSIAMVATTATDASGVEYYFDCITAGGNDSGWQDSTSYEDTVLDANAQYCYRVQARDKSPNQNATGWSATECATTDAEPDIVTTTVYVDQRSNGGVWNSLGIYSFEAGSSGNVKTRTDATDGYVIADAAMWVKSGQSDVIMDSEDSTGVTIVGSWPASTSVSGYWGTNYLHDDNVDKGAKSVTLTPELPSSGDYEVFLRWTASSNRASNVPVDITHVPSGGPDTTPPSPDPMTFASAPAATGDASIEMTATTAIDDQYDVEYYFDCVSGGGHDSDWQSSTYYEDIGLSSGTEYCYTVKARDTSPNLNETAASGSACATTTQPDLTPPEPDPMTFATAPYATGTSSIAMVATTASDESGVEYYFTCVSGGGNNSGWQDETFYEDTELSAGTQYCYTVKARDKSANQNETAASSSACATTDEPDTTPPSPDPMTFATAPYATGTSSIAMVATTATDDSGVEYYFTCVSGGGNDSIWQDETFYEDVSLDPNTEYCYTVKARDKSPSQNTTAASSSVCATTDPVSGEQQLFFDGFESGGFSEGGWVVDDITLATVEDWCGYNSTYGVKLRSLTWIEKAVSTAGYSNIHVKYVRKTGGLDSGEYLYAEWYDGSDWTELEATQDTVWVEKDLSCGAGADNNANFKVRLRLNSNKTNETAFLDNVEVTGTQ
jgi:hypothetical protein